MSEEGEKATIRIKYCADADSLYTDLSEKTSKESLEFV